MPDSFTIQVTVYGHVQGVFFRDFVLKQASILGITGYVRNLQDGKAIKVHAEGKRTKLEELLDKLKIGPGGAKVEKTDITWSDYSGHYSCFSIQY
jgi:acylphosphatase